MVHPARVFVITAPQHKLLPSVLTRPCPLAACAATSLLRKCANATHPEWLAYNFSTAKLSSDDYSYYSDRAMGVLSYLNHKRPWVMKDPRLSWVAPLYLEHMEAPLCILLYRQPQELVAALRKHPEELKGVDVSHEVHMERWTNATLSALQVCMVTRQDAQV